LPKLDRPTDRRPLRRSSLHRLRLPHQEQQRLAPDPVRLLLRPHVADGLTMVAHLARPDGEGPGPAVLIGHDGIGLHEYQRDRADNLAERGYVALAMDYRGARC